MAFAHGKNTVFKLHDSGATLRTLSAYLDSLKVPRKIAMAATTVFGSVAETYLPGIYDTNISGSGKWDPTLDGYLSGVVGLATALTWEWGPAGDTSGFVKMSGSCYLTAYDIDDSISDAVSFSFDLQGTGAVTRGTWP